MSPIRSIRSFLLWRLVGGTALVLLAAGASAYLLLARALERQFDQNLVDRVQGFASILFQVEDEVAFEFSGQLMPDYERETLPAYFEIWYEDGPLLERSESLAGGDLVLPLEVEEEPVHWSAALPDGRAGRYVAQRLEIHHVYPEEGPGRPEVHRVLVAIARGREELAAAETRVLGTCAAFGVLLLGLIAACAWIAVDRGLAPAGRLAAALQAARVERLPEHLEAGGLPQELAPMAETANDLIQRVRVALERERRTTADIAHELRTPISELLTASEVALRDVDDTRHVRRALSTVRDVAWRMGRTVATLLKLARLDAGTESFERERVDLSQMTSELFYTREGHAEERRLCVSTLIDPGETVESDGSVLRIVVSNLISNAVHYAAEGGRVACRLERSPGRWTLVVENDAPDVEPADLALFAEPFWRKDGSRSSRQRSGLGLALSRRLAESAGLELAFELEAGVLSAKLSGREGAPSDAASFARPRS